MIRSLKIIAIWGLLVGSCFANGGQKLTLIDNVLEKTGIIQSVSAIMGMQIAQFMQADPMLPPDVIKALKDLTERKVIVNHYQKAWDRQFTLNELKDISKFANTPTGQKFLRKQGMIQEQMSAIGALLGMDLYGVLHHYSPVKYPLDERSQKMVEHYKGLLDAK